MMLAAMRKVCNISGCSDPCCGGASILILIYYFNTVNRRVYCCSASDSTRYVLLY